MLKCVLVLGSVFLTDERGHTLINAHHVTEFEVRSCGWNSPSCLIAQDGQGYTIGIWENPAAWHGLDTLGVLSRCEAEAMGDQTPQHQITEGQ